MSRKKEKLRYLSLRISDEQKKILEAKARCAGYRYVADYVRACLFMPKNTQDMIMEIHEKVVGHGMLSRVGEK